MKQIMISDATVRAQLESQKLLSFRERLQIALSLEKAGVDAIELPALGGSKEDTVMNRTVASSVKCRVCIPCGDSEESIAAAAACLEGAQDPCLQVILPISTVQMEYMYHMKAEKMLGKIAALCTAARQKCAAVEFVARDATRAEEGFAALCCKTAQENGATLVSLCDDSGNFFPQELGQLVRQVKESCSLPLLVQPSNALRMAAACAVESLLAGADGVKTAACKGSLGIAAVADILRAKADALGATCRLDSTAIHNIIATLGRKNTPVVSSPAAAESSDMALSAECTLADITAAIGSLGYALSEQDIGKVYSEFRRVSSRKDTLSAKELEAIIATAAMQVPSTFHLANYVINSGSTITATAHVTLEKDGKKFSGISTGDGPIDAAFHAIEQIIGHHYELDDFQIQAITKGREAVASSLIRLRADGILYSGNGISTDVVGACIRAYINALNKIVYEG